MDQNKAEEMKNGGAPSKKVPAKKKLLLIAGVILAVVLVAAGVDYVVRNPRCTDEVAALNVVIKKVLMAVDEIGNDDPFSMEVMDNETIDGKEYYVIRLTNNKTGEEVEVGRYYVKASNSKVYVMGDSGKLEAFGG